MRILQINKFFFVKGGPERYMFNIADRLRENGHSVAFFSMQHKLNIKNCWESYFVSNIEYNRRHSFKTKVILFFKTLYSFEAHKKICKLIDDFKPHIAHIHNFHHQLTPSILLALNKKQVPVVISVHDYKMVCPSYSMFNHGKVCELCRDGRFYNCAKARCHKNSFVKSLLVAFESYLHHNLLKSYKEVRYFICPSKFLIQKAQEMGLKGNLIHLSNFVDTNNLEQHKRYGLNRMVYCGRLSPEKGLFCLLEAAKRMPLELEIIGNGPIENELRKQIYEKGIKNIRLLGYLNGDMLFNRMRASDFAVVPSEWYENSPISILEAFALGMPVVGAHIGGIPEFVKDGETGLTFEPGNVGDLVEKIRYMISNLPKLREMGRKAKDLVERKYSSEIHYEKLMKIYQQAIDAKQ